jgi:hypothetical protein
MSRLIDKLLSPNLWILLVTLLAIAGEICMVTGFIIRSRPLTYAGMWLVAPLVLGGVLLLVIVTPIVIVADRRHKQK